MQLNLEKKIQIKSSSFNLGYNSLKKFKQLVLWNYKYLFKIKKIRL